MTTPALHSTPTLRDVLHEQVRALGLALRWPAIAAGGLLVVATVLVVMEFVTGGGPVDFAPELSMIPGVVGALLPIGIWKGEERLGAGFLWTLPVDRRHHALVKVCAGWVCLMAAIAVLVLWFFLLALVTGGNILADQVLRVMPSVTMPASGTMDPSALRLVSWTPEPRFWLVPFTAATGTYLLASALALGSRHPLRWMIGMVLTVLLFSALGSATRIEWIRFAPSHFAVWFFEGPYGLDALLSARAESLKTEVTLSTGKTIGVWRDLPSVRIWAHATLLWITAGLLTLLAASSRHRERGGALVIDTGE